MLKIERTQRELFWKTRAEKYQQLEWAIKGGYLHEFLETGRFLADDEVLDVGTGTGIIAHTLSPHIKKIIGIDISEEMLSHAKQNKRTNEEFFCMDATDLMFPDNTFTKVTARMVFHHIIDRTQIAMNECFRVLQKRGKIVFSEGVPPTEHVIDFYRKMFKLKEERLTFMENDLVQLLENAGFSNITKKVYVLPQASIRNWLSNSGLELEIQDRIFTMHINLDEQGKRDYNMQIHDNDCFIDMKFVLLVAEK